MAAFVDESCHVAVVVEGEWCDGASHVGVNVLAGGCLAKMAVEWRAGCFAYETPSACEAWWRDFIIEESPAARLCMAM